MAFSIDDTKILPSPILPVLADSSIHSTAESTNSSSTTISILTLGKNSTEIQNILLDNLGVATVAGTSFGEYGEGYIRLSCANSDTSIEEAISRIKDFFN